MSRNTKPKVLIGFHNGIGNWVAMTPALQALSKAIDGKIDVALNPKWEGEGRKAVELLASRSSFVNKVLKYESGLLGKYPYRYMSFHGVQDEVFFDMNKDRDVVAGLPDWLKTLTHESTWYFDEMERYLGLTLEDCVQETPSGKKIDCLPERYIAISNGFLANGFKGYENKGWAYWNELIDVVRGYFQCDVVAIGGEDKKEWASYLDVYDLTGQTNILETIFVIENSMALVSTDTGVFHLADAMCKPGVVMFGPTLVSKNGPLNGTMIPVRANRKCAPCQGTIRFSECNGGCMSDITVPMVMKELRKLL